GLRTTPSLLLRQRQGELDETAIVERESALHRPTSLESVEHLVLGGAPPALQLASDRALGMCRKRRDGDLPGEPILKRDASDEVRRDPVRDVPSPESPPQPLDRPRNERKHTRSHRVAEADRRPQPVERADVVADPLREREQTQPAEQVSAVRGIPGQPLVAAIPPERDVTT